MAVATALDKDHSPVTAANISAAAGRVLISAIFILSGLSKLAAPAATIGYIDAVGLPFAPVAFAAAVAVEVVGGVALIAGFKTRWVAGVLALFSVVTAIAFHANLADQNQFIHFFKNIAMAGGLLQVIAFGAGAISLDARKG
jgi:putative oxidoreductase